MICLLVAGIVQAAELPSWWRALPRMSRLESDFVQESESAVFGKLKKEGHLQMASGGRLRVTYTKGLLLVSDGVSLIQYDPAARTAQRLELRSATRDMPLLNLLVDPAALEAAYSIKAESEERIQLEPKRKDLPKVTVEGRDGFLKRVTWIDATGAKQALELKAPRVPKSSFPATTFVFTAPVGTRWIG
jgi:outer membrane lipoprotein-sorting protein